MTVHARPALIGNVFGDAWDFAVDNANTALLIIGTVATAGTYGWVTGILTEAESVGVQEGMKAVAAGAETTVERYAKTGKVSPPGFFEAWKGQTIYRTKKMIEVGGVGLANAALAQLASYVDPAALDFVANGWEKVKQSEAYARDSEAAKRAHLDDLVRTCLGSHVPPAAGLPRTICRPDMVAQAANLASGANLYDTTSWDPVTGAPPPPAVTNMTPAEALAAWQDAVKRAGSADTPEAAAALEIYRAAQRLDAKRKADKASLVAMATKAAADAQAACAAGNAQACGAINAVAKDAAVARKPLVLDVLGRPITLVVLGAALTSPFWWGRAARWAGLR